MRKIIVVGVLSAILTAAFGGQAAGQAGDQSMTTEIPERTRAAVKSLLRRNGMPTGDEAVADFFSQLEALPADDPKRIQLEAWLAKSAPAPATGAAGGGDLTPAPQPYTDNNQKPPAVWSIERTPIDDLGIAIQATGRNVHDQSALYIFCSTEKGGPFNYPFGVTVKWDTTDEGWMRGHAVYVRDGLFRGGESDLSPELYWEAGVNGRATSIGVDGDWVRALQVSDTYVAFRHSLPTSDDLVAVLVSRGIDADEAQEVADNDMMRQGIFSTAANFFSTDTFINARFRLVGHREVLQEMIDECPQ